MSTSVNRSLKALLGLLAGVPLILFGLYSARQIENRLEQRLTDAQAFTRLATPLDGTKLQANLEGKAIVLNGQLVAHSLVRDSDFDITFPEALLADRKVTMYQNREIWRSYKNQPRSLEGYEQVWSDQPIACPSRLNPTFPLASKRLEATKVTLGVFEIPPALLFSLKTDQIVPQKTLDVSRFASAGRWSATEDGTVWTLDRGQPGLDVGDCRVQFLRLNAPSVTISAMQTGQTVSPFIGPKGTTIFDLVTGSAPVSEIAHRKETKIQEGHRYSLLLGAIPVLLGVLLIAVGTGLVSNDAPKSGCLVILACWVAVCLAGYSWLRFSEPTTDRPLSGNLHRQEVEADIDRNHRVGEGSHADKVHPSRSDSSQVVPSDSARGFA